VEEVLIQMYLAGVSVRRVENITEALWGMRLSPSTVSDLNKKIYETIETWRNRPIEGEHPYVYLDGIATMALYGPHRAKRRELLGSSFVTGLADALSSLMIWTKGTSYSR
jgi:hypothetical protein